MPNTNKILTEENEIYIFEPTEQDVKRQQTSNYQSQKLFKPFDSAAHLGEQNINVQGLVGLITHQIQHAIQKSQINFSDQKKPFEIIEKNYSSPFKTQSQKFDEKKISQLVKKRKDLEEQIRILKFQKSQQKLKSKPKSPQQDHSYKTFRSKFTSKQQMQISRIIRKREQFQHKLQIKDKELSYLLQTERQIKQSKQKKQLQQFKKKKKQEAIKKIKKIQEQQHQRREKIKIENKNYQKLKKIKTLYEKIEEHDKSYQQQKREKQFQILKQKKQSMTFDFTQIKNHEKKWYQTARQSKQKLQNKILQKIQKIKEDEKFQNQTFRPSKFLLTLWNEQKLKEQLERDKIQKMKSLFMKKNYFQEQLRGIHKQQIKSKSKSKSQIKKPTIKEKLPNTRIKLKSMSAADIYKQGQQFMKSAHSNIKPALIQQSKVQLENHYKSLKQGSKVNYRDYLQEEKIKKELLSKFSHKLNTRENPEIHELEHIISNKKENLNEKIYKAKLIAQKLDQKAKNSSTNALVDSISAKLKIIEKFS